jgi:hypothetical protein
MDAHTFSQKYPSSVYVAFRMGPRIDKGNVQGPEGVDFSSLSCPAPSQLRSTLRRLKLVSMPSSPFTISSKPHALVSIQDLCALGHIDHFAIGLHHAKP